MARLDQALVVRGLCESREKAKRAILAGQVKINDQRARKPSDPVREQDRLSLEEPQKYVSRGGHKLEHALRHFQLDVSGWTAIDLGASTGGFTDCLLQHGVAKVYAVDVGRGQIAWKLRCDHRVIVMDRTNARKLSPAIFPEPFKSVDLIAIDCSFISLRLLLPAAAELVRPGGYALPLIKPQFEAGKAEVDRGEGVITEPSTHRRVLAELEQFAREELPKFTWHAVAESPLLGPAGNKEFFALLEKADSTN